MGLLATLGVGWLLWQQPEPLVLEPVRAADHTETPALTADHAADINDIYAWHDSAAGKLFAIISFAGRQPIDTLPIYDPNVLYTLNIDNTGDNVEDISIHCRFGDNGAGQFGIRVENLPGATGPVVGPVETTLTSGSARVFAGIKDDPFFFDLVGFRETVDMGTLRFDSTRDDFVPFNIMAIVLEMDLAQAQGSSTSFKVWGTTGRKA